MKKFYLLRLLVLLNIKLCFCDDNDINSFQFPSFEIDREFLTPTLDGVLEKKMENSVIKTKVNFNLKEIFRESIENIKTKNKKIDIIFLIDSSSSIGKVNFYSEISFVKKLVSHFDLSFNYTRIALITFSSQAKVIRHIDQISSPSEDHDQCSVLNYDIPKIKFIGGGTFTYGALKEAKKIFNTARDTSKKYIFLVTDGFSNGRDPVSMATELKNNNVTIFTIGIQSGNSNELYNISSDPKEYHNFLLDSFVQFEKLARGALFKDYKPGYSITLKNTKRCNILCEKRGVDLNGTEPCCNANSNCECHIPSGHYSCSCPPGFIGDGAVEPCLPCMSRTYWARWDLCLPCPDINHITEVFPATSINECVCKAGFRATEDHRCEGITCQQLLPPENGYFVKQPTTCANVLNAACGARCKSGYQLTGTSLRLCQEDGSWSGTEAKCILKTCPRLQVPYNGMISCTNHDSELESFEYSPYNDTFMDTYEDETKRITEPMPIDTECNYKCGLGYYLVGSRSRNCLPLSKWDGLQTTCKSVLCSPLPKPKYGDYELNDCTEIKVQYGTNCSLICPSGFNVKGPSSKMCSGRKTGFWTPRNKNPRCVDNIPPEIVCPDDLTLTLPSDENMAVLNFLPKPKKLIDSSELNVTFWSKPEFDEKNGLQLTVGPQVITYVASDMFNNKAECNFKVTVIDNTPPIVENCIDPEAIWILPNYNVNQNSSATEWDEPIFFDNSNEDVIIERSLDKNNLTPGFHQIIYTGFDSSKNNNSCILNVTIKELSCVPLTPPLNGLAFCAKNLTHTWCEISCNMGYAIYKEEANEYVDNLLLSCKHSYPEWKYNPLPDCTMFEVPESIEQMFTIALDSDDNNLCSNNQIKDNMTKGLSDYMKDHLCRGDKDCDVISEIPDCILDESTIEKEDRNFYRIEKREVPSVNVHSKKPRKSRAHLRIRLYTKIGKRLGIWLKNSTLSENVRQIKNELQSLHTNTQLRQILGELDIDVKEIQIDELTRCPDGSVSKHYVCFQCPQGSYHDAAFDRCRYCPLGSYNSELGQTKCLNCPPHYSTRREGRNFLHECKELCPPGTIAKKRQMHKNPRPGMGNPRSLMPFCKKCQAGEYQPDFDQTSCLPCPSQFTSIRGSSDLSNCKKKGLHPCHTNPFICGLYGKCVPESGGINLYSCACTDGYVGAHCRQKIDLCLSAPCYNNGVCFYLNQTTISCQCPTQFTGQYCEVRKKSCDTIVCQNNGVCIESEDQAICECSSGFIGSFCENQINHCISSPCESGICHSTLNGYLCQCPPGIIGRRCHLKPCDYFPCHRNAICQDLKHFPASRKSYVCVCPKGLKGYDCMNIHSPCEVQPCKNNGKCIPIALRQTKNVTDILRNMNLDDDKYGKYECICPPYFYGSNCETLVTPDFIMQFSKTSTMNFVKAKGPTKDLKEISFCTWIKTNDISNYGTVLSYATQSDDNVFTLTDYSGFILYINGNSTTTDIVANDGLWHFICVAWSNDKGIFEIYMDGRLKHTGYGLGDQQVISSNGIFIIGQEQDIMGGGFSELESFIGSIAYLDIWDSFLTARQVLEYYTSCEPYQGSIYSWTDFKMKTHGEIEITKSGFCQRCSQDLQVSHGYVRTTNSRAFYNCNSGYSLRGFPVRNCLRTSEWSSEVPFCEMVKCGRLISIENGYVQQNGFTYNSEGIYFCNNGYLLEGNKKRTCSANGRWTGTPPSCKSSVKCPKLTSYPDIKIIYANDKGMVNIENDISVGTYAEISCDGRNSSIDLFLTCNDDGQWDNVIPITCSSYTRQLKTTSQKPKEFQSESSSYTEYLSNILLSYRSTTWTSTTPKIPNTDRIEMSNTQEMEMTTTKNKSNIANEKKIILSSLFGITYATPPSTSKNAITTTFKIKPTAKSITTTTTTTPLTTITRLTTQRTIPVSTKRPHTIPLTSTLGSKIKKTTLIPTINPSFGTEDVASVSFSDIDSEPDKTFWTDLKIFLHSGCRNNSKLPMCIYRLKNVPYNSLDDFKYPDSEEFQKMDVKLLEYIKDNEKKILTKHYVLYEDYFFMLLYGNENPLLSQRLPVQMEDALRFSLCSFIDAISCDTNFRRSANKDNDLIENRSGILKLLISKVSVPFFIDYKMRLSHLSSPLNFDSTETNLFSKTKRSDIRTTSRTSPSINDYIDNMDCSLESLPQPPSNGYFIEDFESILVGTRIAYDCLDNHKSYGNRITVCQDDGTWTEIDYFCQILVSTCDAPKTPSYLTYDNDSGIKKYPIGTHLNLRCTSGTGSWKIECLPTGHWTSILVKCLLN